MELNKNNKISVLMCTYQEPLAWIEDAINSILRQTYKNIEMIIIVDDPHNYALIELLKQYENRYSIIKVLINRENVGLVKSLNRGIEYCTGDFIARMDADDISNVNRLEVEMEYLIENDLDLVGSKMEWFYEDRILGVGNICYSHWGCSEMLKIHSSIAHPTWLLKKELMNKLHGYRNIDACEDYDFLIRAVLSNFKIGNVPQVLLSYRDNPNSISHKKRYSQKEITRYIAKKYKNNVEISLVDLEAFCKDIKFEDNIRAQKNIQENIYQFKVAREVGDIKAMIVKAFSLLINRRFYNRIAIEIRERTIRIIDMLLIILRI